MQAAFVYIKQSASDAQYCRFILYRHKIPWERRGRLSTLK